MIRILGIDPGSRITGYGVIESNGMQSRHIQSGVLRLQDQDLALRLGQIFAGLSRIIEACRPQMVAIEQVFVAKNPASALKLGQARGAAICAAANSKLEVTEYTPTRIKQAVVGTGHAEKEQVQHMVSLILKLQDKPTSDAADALAVALCHAHSQLRLSSPVAGGLRR